MTLLLWAIYFCIHPIEAWQGWVALGHAARAHRHNEKLFAKWDRDREAERADRLRHPEKYRGQ